MFIEKSKKYTLFWSLFEEDSYVLRKNTDISL